MESWDWRDASRAVDDSCHVKENRPCARIARRGLPASPRRFDLLSSSCIIIVACVIISNAGLATAGIVLPVIRSFSNLDGSGAKNESQGMSPEHAKQLRQHDFQRSRRHGRALTTAVVDFPLQGNEYYVGLYYTEIRLGSPSSKYYVQVDTGSDLLWVNCKPCSVCPTRSDLSISLHLYDPAVSSTSKNSSCSSDTCQTLATIVESSCVDSSCYYAFSYGDRSTAMGYLVEDAFTYDTVTENRTFATTNVVFGCGFNQSGSSLTSSSRAVDGIMGFGAQTLSVVSQLADSGLTTSEFAHCLQGDTGDGGVFIIGDVQEPGIIYTSLVANQYHYNVALLGIAVGNTDLKVSPSVFDASNYRGEAGTIFDSGTTLALLVDEAYDAFVDELLAVVSVQAVSTSDAPDTPCFEYSDSDLSAAFPSVTLKFDGAVMQLGPTNYLYKLRVGASVSVWCLGWSRSSSSGLDGLTILGDIVLKNKLVVYDLGNEQIGWVDFDCQSTVRVSNGSVNQVLDPQQENWSSGCSLLRVYHTLAILLVSMAVAYATSLP